MENLKSYKNKIENLIKNEIRKSIKDINNDYCTKIFIDYKEELRALRVPNQLWSTCYMEKILCTIPNMKKIFDYKSCGNIKDNLTTEQYEKVIRLLSEDDEITIEESIAEIENEDIRFLYWYEYYDEAIQKHIDNFIDNLSIEIKDNLEITINYNKL